MVYLNNAATSWPKPAAVEEAMVCCLREPPEDPYRQQVTRTSSEQRCRDALVGLLGLDTGEGIVFTSGATESLNLALHGLLPSGGVAVTTDLEHNAVLRPLYLQRERGAEVRIVPHRRLLEQLPTALEGADLVVVGHVSNVTGWVQDLSSVYDQCQKKGIPLLVDAAQSLGSIEVPVAGLPLAAVAFTGHKALLGPQGTGGLVLGSQVRPLPWKVGGTGIHSALEGMPTQMPLRYEAGTPNRPGLAGLAAAVSWLGERGVQWAGEHKSRLAIRLGAGLRDLGASVWLEGGGHAGVVSFDLAPWEPTELAYVLAESFDIQVRAGLHCAPLVHRALGTWPRGTVRASLSALSTEADVDTLLGALADLAI